MKFFFTFIFFIFLTTTAYASVSVDVPLRHWTYDIVDRFAARGIIDVSGFMTRPLTRLQMAELTKQAISILKNNDGASKEEYLDSLETDLNKLIAEYRDELLILGQQTVVLDDYKPAKTAIRVLYPLRLERVGTDLSKNDSTLLENRCGWTLKEGENIRVSVRTWARIEDFICFSAEPTYYQNRDDSDSTFEEGYFKFNISNLEVLVGRTSLWWGPGYHGSLVLTNNAPPMDMLKLSWNFKKIANIHTQYFISELSHSRNDAPHAKLTGFRINIEPSKNLVLGCSKVIMLGGERKGDSLNPIDIANDFIFLNENEKQNNNQILAFDALYRFKSLITYGQYAFDGEQDDGFSNPAYLAGAYMADIFNKAGLSLRTEYANTKDKGDHSWYSHDLYSDGYTHKGYLLGHHMGGDADDLFVRLEQQGLFDPRLALALQYDQQNEGLSLPNTEQRDRYGIDLTFFKTEIVECKFGYFFESIKNYLNTKDEKARNHIFELSAKVEF